jgi:hypothetical protein
MSQKIKKQIKKSIPIFMIFSLIFSTSVAGLVFNLDFRIVNIVNEKLSLDFSLSEVLAQDVASTTVKVRNAPPILVGNVEEFPASASNTPVNVGEQAVWQATANDPEENDYYLIVCSANGAEANESAAPTCLGGAGNTFCVSGVTETGEQATCIDSFLADPGFEFQAWYAFVCDNHSLEAECSAVNQGNGDSGTPLYINHAPNFSAVITSDNNKDPGEVFTVTASVIDLDVEGGADEIILSVCSTNGWATSTGCTAATWCTGTSTSPDVSCSFATTTPAVDGTYAYYAFVKDWHNLSSTVVGRTANYTVNNVAPSVSNVVVNGGEAIEVNMKGDVEYVASSSADLYDANSCLDIINSPTPATSSIFLSTVTGGLNCAANPNDCYQITNANCTYVPGSCEGSGDTTARYICTVSIAHHAIATDIDFGNPNFGANWLAGMTAIDDNGLKGSGTSISGVNLIALNALGVNENEIAYGSVRGGQNTGDYNATTTIVNFGNVPINTEVEGTSMIKSDLTDVIVESMQRFDDANFIYGDPVYTLSSTTPVTVDTEIAKPTSSTDVSDQIFWGIGIPGGTSSGDYAGTNTFTAVLDDQDW